MTIADPALPGPAALVRSLVPPFAFAGIGIARGGAVPEFHIACAPGIRAGEHTMFRVASISKVVTGLTARRVGLDPPRHDPDIADLLGFALRHPAFPDIPLTVSMVASHAAGLTDAAGYQVPPGMALADWIAAQGPAIFGPRRPGTHFDYCNLGYILLGAATEAAAGDRFDRLARAHVLAPLGIAGGFNWAGVSPADRAAALPTYRRDGARLTAQIDAAVPPTGIVLPDGTALAEGAATATALAPQGGLRTSLAGCLTLARSLEDADATPLWTPQGGSMDPTGGLFHSYGMGLQILPDPPFYPRPLIGHFANAYGFTGGVWWDRQAGAAFAYGLNGLPPGDEADDLSPEELQIFRSVAATVG